MKDKLLCKWLTMDVSDVKNHGAIRSIMSLFGIIVNSNFVEHGINFEVPVLTARMECINIGDRVKLTFFTRASKVKDNPKATLEFSDEGLKYERFVGSSWELLFEDFSKDH